VAKIRACRRGGDGSRRIEAEDEEDEGEDEEEDDKGEREETAGEESRGMEEMKERRGRGREEKRVVVLL